LERKLRICPDCKNEILDDEANFCNKCGAALPDQNPNHREGETEATSHDRLEPFTTEVPEVPIAGATEDKRDDGPRRREDDDLEITSTANILNDEAENNGGPKNRQSSHELIGSSQPPLPDFYEGYDQGEDGPGTDYSQGDSTAEPNKLKSETDPSRNAGESAENEKPFIPDWQKDDSGPKRARESQVEKESGSIRPIEDPAQIAPTLKESPKIKGLAYFRKNSIRIVGNPFLHEGDEIVFNNKNYVLKPRKLDRKTVFGTAGAILAVILVIIGLSIVNKPALSGNGEIIGMILDENGKPYLEGARVEIPSINKTTMSNPQGFFRFELIPTGTYEITYKLGEKYIGSGNATVTDRQTTMMTFTNLERIIAEKQNEDKETSTVKSSRPAESKTTKNASSTDSRNAGGLGKIRLKANVENARLAVDGKTLGAGNNLYTGIKAGTRKVTVDKVGYITYSGEIGVKSGQTTPFEVNLIRKTEGELQNLSAEEYFNLGKDAYAAAKFNDAIEDFTRAVELSPGLADAYFSRAEAYAKTGENERAAGDYVRYGEIQRIKGRNDQAVSAFSSALTLSPGNIAALVGRGGAKADNGDYRMGLNDYEEALKFDGQCYSALFGAGVCQFRLANYKKAEKYFQQAYEIDKSDPYLYHYMMLNYLARDDIKNVQRIYAEFKTVADPAMLAEFKSSSRFQPILRLIEEENR
jgi:tetratricopeptide (TPR) repeat protein